MASDRTGGQTFVFDSERSKQKFRTWFPELSLRELDGLVFYLSQLVRFNKTINLVSPSSLHQAESVHIADAVLATRIVAHRVNVEAPVFDFGSGNGIPGLIYGILNPDQEVILVDRDQRKIEFCKHVAGSLKLTKMKFLVQGAEELADCTVQNAMARGFAPFSRSLAICQRALVPQGRFFHLKGSSWSEELSLATQDTLSGWSTKVVGQYRLPDLDVEMFVVLTEKSV